MNLKSLLALVIGVCLSRLGLAAPPLEFTAEGELTYRVLYQGETTYHIAKNFRIQRNGNRWLIRTSDQLAAADLDHFNLYEETAADGFNLYQLTVQDVFAQSWQLLLARGEPELPDPRRLTVLGKVSAGVVPVETTTGVDAVWLAYAATPYFDGITNGHVRTLQLISPQFPELATVIASWRVEPKFPRVLASVDYHNDGRTVVQTADAPDQIQPWPAPYEHGFVDAKYTAEVFTNLAGFHVPLKFSYTTWWPDYAATNRLVIASSVEGRLTRFKAGVNGAPLLPKFPRTALITDQRFAGDGVREFNYTIPAGASWLAATDPKIDAYLRMFKKNPARPLPPPKPVPPK